MTRPEAEQYNVLGSRISALTPSDTSRLLAEAIAGLETPPFRQLTSEEEREAADRINATRPDIVWVGLGCPKQDLWMARNRPLVTAPVLVGVGAAFDFLAGVKRQAPRWIQRWGPEWLFHLSCEPARLWRRYLVHNTVCLFQAAAQATGLRKYPITGS